MTPAEHHLGDRLAALVDGELGHDARERVLSHLATCRSCKAEADAQRRLKNVFADTAPPPPSDGLMARLQGLPAGGGAETVGRAGPDDTDGGPGGPGAGDGAGTEGREALPVAGLPGGVGRSPWTFDYLPVGRGGGRGPLTPSKGFRIHEVHRVDRAERAAAALRGRRRFAFAAAGAFSLAALAIGGVATGTAGPSPVVKGDGSGASASPVRPAPSGAASRDNRRRTPVGEHRNGVLSASTAASLSASTFAASAARGLPGGRSGIPSAAPPLLLSSFAAPQGPLQHSATSQLRPQGMPSAAAEADWFPEAGGAETVVSTTGPSTLRSFPGRVPMATAPAGAPSATFAPPVR